MAIDEKKLGPEHPNVAASLNNLAKNFQLQGKYSEAKPLYKRALEIWEKVLGNEHPLVLTALENYVGFLNETGDNDEAQRYEVRIRSSAAKTPKIHSKNHEVIEEPGNSG